LDDVHDEMRKGIFSDACVAPRCRMYSSDQVAAAAWLTVYARYRLQGGACDHNRRSRDPSIAAEGDY
jgi:hypothetical protein